jgi:hypothetical protein
MRLSVVLLCCSLAGIILGAALIGTAAVGAAVIFDSLSVGLWALMRDDGAGPQVAALGEARTLHDIFERTRAS